MISEKKIYFASDLHLGLPNYEKSLIREKIFIRWLDEIKYSAQEIYLLGDIFDFWFEYKSVVPKGFTRFLGKISELTDNGIPIHFFTGNHDLWAFDYLQHETGMIIHRKPEIKEWNGKKFYLAHGDGLGPFDYKFKFLKSIFTNHLLQWLFARIHPNAAFGFAHAWSHKSRKIKEYPIFKSEESEWLIQYAKQTLKKEHYDYFIFGHRHVPLKLKLSDSCQYINLGDWLYNFTYAVYNGHDVELLKFHTKS